MTLVSSANIVGFNEEFIHRGRSFTYNTNCKSPRIDRWETPCFKAPKSDKKNSEALDDVISNFFSLFFKQDLDRSTFTPW